MLGSVGDEGLGLSRGGGGGWGSRHRALVASLEQHRAVGFPRADPALHLQVRPREEEPLHAILEQLGLGHLNGLPRLQCRHGLGALVRLLPDQAAVGADDFVRSDTPLVRTKVLQEHLLVGLHVVIIEHRGRIR